MIPQRVTLQNFLSFGKKEEITFTDDEPLWCICGPNGVGKSAIFDAITYCLYGEHRGGKGAGHPLIRHGENGFSVSFEFRLHDAEYRIARNRPRSGQPTQSVEVRTTSGDWRTIENLNAVADVNAWVVSTLGIGSESFKASVMLRQGEANNVVEASGSERHKILSKVIGLERFETLSESIVGELRDKKAKHKALKDQIDVKRIVTQDQLDAAEAARTSAEGECETAEAAKAAAARRVTDAERWAELQADIATVERELAEAEERSRHADEIHRKHERATELEQVLPPLERWLNVGKEISKNETVLAALQPDLATAELACTEAEQRSQDAKTRKSLDEVLTTLERQLTLAKESERLAGMLAKFPNDLAEQFQSATHRLENARVAERAAGDTRTQTRTHRQRAESEAERLAKVEVGVKCSRCGKIVDAEHADQERRTAAEEVERWLLEFRAAELRHRSAEEEFSAAKTGFEHIQKQWNEREQIHGLWKANLQNLQTLGIKESLAELRLKRNETLARRDALPAGTSDAEAKFAQAGKRFDELKQRSTELTMAAAALQASRKAIADGLNERYHATSTNEYRTMHSEAERLRAENVAGQYRELLGDIQRKQDRLDRVQQLRTKAAEIPADARITVQEARRLESEAAALVKHARQRLDAAMAESSKLRSDAEAYAKLQTEIVVAETEERLHDKLNKLLGRGGLQRELMREAEEEIVRHADGIVRNLSNGDLSIELNPSEKKENEALVLQVRRAESPDPIPVEYLSGSQKFRVAISIALAIGRFATGQTRPLESVIIDEGFGSLDKDGLEATAQELKRLKNYLKRIILVSHQDDFIEHFPATIRLKPGENGTVVDANHVA